MPKIGISPQLSKGIDVKLFNKALFITMAVAACHSLESLSIDYKIPAMSWKNEDFEKKTSFLGLDNNSFATLDEILDDPFIQIRSELYPTYMKVADDSFKNRHLKEKNKLAVTNANTLYTYRAPQFYIVNPSDNPVNEMQWQISNDPDFHYVVPTLSRTQKFASFVTIDPLGETFLNNDETYYFRVRNVESETWSSSFEFQVKKPEGIIDVEFEKLENGLYEINWERYAEEKSDSLEYLVFGSNSLDFLPSVYSDTQVNKIVDGIVVDIEHSDNLIAITSDTKITVPGNLAYYRIIVRQYGQLSVPSRLIHVYDVDLVQPRNVLQYTPDETGALVAKRVLIPTTYPWSASLPRVKNHVKNIPTLFNMGETVFSINATTDNYAYNSYVPIEVWDQVTPYFLPENHPAKPKLDRIFSKRVTLTPDTFKKAGFPRFTPGRHNRIMVSSHAELRDYYVKAFSDLELRIVADWMKLIHRIHGANAVRECIKKHGYEKIMKVPRKWIYPLPMNPSPPNSPKYLRKNFILIAENAHSVTSEDNRKMYKNKITKAQVEALFNVFYEVGLWDSVFAFNVPFCKDGKIAFIDTEYHHKWPVPFQKMSRYFSSEMNKLWLKLAASVPDKPTDQ